MWRKSIGSDTDYFCPKLCRDEIQGCSKVAEGLWKTVEDIWVPVSKGQ